MKQYLNRERIALAVSIGLLLLPVIAGGIYVAYKHQWAEGRLAELEPRYARLLGLQSSRAGLASAESEARALLGHYAYPGSQDVSQAGNDAQQRLRSIFSAAGLEVVSSQVLAPKTEKNFDRIPLTVRLEGELAAFQSAFVVLASQSPAILVDGFGVQTIGVVKPDAPQRLASQLSLSVLRVRP